MLDGIKMYFFPCLINSLTVIYIVGKLINKKAKWNKKTLFIIFLLSFGLSLINSYVNDLLKFFFSSMIIIISAKLIFNDNYYKIIISTIIEQIIMLFSELIFFIFLAFFINNIDILFYNYFGVLISNIIICIIALILLSCKNLVEIFKKFNDFICKIKQLGNYIIVMLFLTIVNFLLFYIYDNYMDKYLMVFNVFLMIFYMLIVYLLFNEKNKTGIYQKENQILIENLNEYEKMLDYQRVNNHENKNQLLVIKSMIEKKNENIIEYINEIVKEKREDNEIVYNKAKRIPTGGLQGLIYQKMLLMQEKNIEINLDISKDIRKIDFSKISSKMNYDICRIMGIILDNAIEETINFNVKEREILISMYIDDKFVIEVSNRIKDNIDLNKIYEKGYTSKEKGHGYGLSLLKKIIAENDKILNEVRIINNIFTQVIKIKM